MEPGYEGLEPAEQERFDGLMNSPMGGWPEGLRKFYAEERPTSGDWIADVVGRWVKMQRYTG